MRRMLMTLTLVLFGVGAYQEPPRAPGPTRLHTPGAVARDCTPIDPTVPSDCPTFDSGTGGDAQYDAPGPFWPASFTVVFQSAGITFIGTASINGFMGFGSTQAYRFTGQANGGTYCSGNITLLSVRPRS